MCAWADRRRGRRRLRGGSRDACAVSLFFFSPAAAYCVITQRQPPSPATFSFFHSWLAFARRFLTINEGEREREREREREKSRPAWYICRVASRTRVLGEKTSCPKWYRKKVRPPVCRLYSRACIVIIYLCCTPRCVHTPSDHPHCFSTIVILDIEIFQVDGRLLLKKRDF